MGKLTMADLAFVQAAIDEASASMVRALAAIENAASAMERRGCCGACQGADFGDCACCEGPSGRVYGGGGADA